MWFQPNEVTLCIDFCCFIFYRNIFLYIFGRRNTSLSLCDITLGFFPPFCTGTGLQRSAIIGRRRLTKGGWFQPALKLWSFSYQTFGAAAHPDWNGRVFRRRTGGSWMSVLQLKTRMTLRHLSLNDSTLCTTSPNPITFTLIHTTKKYTTLGQPYKGWWATAGPSWLTPLNEIAMGRFRASQIYTYTNLHTLFYLLFLIGKCICWAGR